jgi:hypothetical protein
VAGFDREKGSDPGRGLTRTGQDLVRGVKDAAKNAGDMAEEAIG